MTRNQTTISLGMAITLLLMATQLLSGILSLLSFERGQLQTVLSAYDAVGGDLAAKMERALSFGKPLEKFVGIEAYLQQAKRISPELNNVCVLAPEGTLLSGLAVGPLPDFRLAADMLQVHGSRVHLHQNGVHFLLYPLHNADKLQVGWLSLVFLDSDLQAQRVDIFWHVFQGLLVITGVATVLLVCGFAWRTASRQAGTAAHRFIRVLLFVTLGGTQLGFSLYSANLFQADYLRLTEHKALIVARLLQQDVEELLRRGLHVATLLKIDTQLAQMVDRVDEIAYLGIEDERQTVQYEAGVRKKETGPMLRYLELQAKSGAAGRIVVALDGAAVKKAVRAIVWDSLTVALLSLLFGLELVSFLLVSFSPRATADSNRPAAGQYSHYVRMAVFLFIFSATLGHSFIALQMVQLYRPIFGLSRELVLGLPLALEMLGGGLILIPAGRWIDLRGWHEAFLVGVGLSALGSFLSGLAASPEWFIAARFISGVGYGLAWMAGQGYVLLHAGEKNRAQEISLVVAGIFTGIICGNGMGALLAERLGFSMVFSIGAVGMLLALTFPLVTMRPTFLRPLQSAKATLSARYGFLRLICDGQALLIFSCSLMPYSITMVGLLYYVVPLYLKGLGAEQSDIGRIIILFGLCMIFVAPKVSRLADNRSDKRSFVIAGGLLASTSLLVFLIPGALGVTALSVFLFGLSVSISAPSRNVISLALPAAREVGVSQVMGVYRTIDKFGQTLGALVPGSLMLFFPLPQAAVVMGFGYLLLTLLLIWRLRDHTGGESTRKS